MRFKKIVTNVCSCAKLRICYSVFFLCLFFFLNSSNKIVLTNNTKKIQKTEAKINKKNQIEGNFSQEKYLNIALLLTGV